MRWIKAAIVGLLGSLVMFVIMYFGIHVSGMAPFNVPPSAAFLLSLGLPAQPLALLAHFGYGAFWSMVFVGMFGESMSIGKGLMLATGLWLLMMVVYSPIIGWGLFGMAGSRAGVAPDSPLYLSPGPKYAVMTAILHFVYGAIIGWLNPVLIDFESRSRATAAGPGV